MSGGSGAVRLSSPTPRRRKAEPPRTRTSIRSGSSAPAASPASASTNRSPPSLSSSAQNGIVSIFSATRLRRPASPSEPK